MAIALLLVQFVLCLVVLYRDVVQDRFAHYATGVFFLGYTLVLVVEPLVLHLFFGGPTSIVAYSTAVFEDPALFAVYNGYGIVLLLAALALSGLRRRGAGGAVARGEPVSTTRDDGRTASVLLVLGCALFVYSTGMTFRELANASRFAWYQQEGFSVFWLLVSHYLAALAAVYAYALKVATSRRWRLLAAAALAATVLQGLLSKDRKWLIFLVSGWLAGHYELSGRKVRLTARRAGVLVAMFALLLASQFLRDVLTRYWLGEQVVLSDEIARWQVATLQTGDISYFYRATVEALHQNIHNGFLVPLGVLRRHLFFFLPVGYSGGLKVEDLSATFADLVEHGTAARRGNMPPGLFGLFVISFGWLGTFAVVPLLAVALEALNGLFRKGSGLLRMVLLSLFLAAVALGLRGDDSSAIYFAISSLVLVGAGRLLTARTRRRRVSGHGGALPGGATLPRAEGMVRP
jgi:hypothetical protein